MRSRLLVYVDNILQEMSLPADPLEGPISLVLYGWHRVYGMKELMFLLRVLDV